MKHTLLYFCTLLFISISVFGQKQVTDFDGRVLRYESLEPLGQINDFLYYLNSHQSVSKINLKTYSKSTVVNFANENSTTIAILAGERLILGKLSFNNWVLDVSEVNKVTGELTPLFSYQKVNYISKIANVLYITLQDNQETLKVSFGERNHYVENFHKGNISANRGLELQNQDGTQIRGFVDNTNTFYEVSQIGNNSRVLETAQFFIIRNSGVPVSIYVVNKNSKKVENYVANLYDLHQMFDFFEINGKLHALEAKKNQVLPKEKPTVNYSVYEIEEDKKTLKFSKDLSEFSYYSASSGLMGPMYGQAYSNTLYADSSIYFWASDSLSVGANTRNKKLVSINLRNGETNSKSIINSPTVYDVLKYEYPFYDDFTIFSSDEKIVTTTGYEDFYSFSYNIKQKTFESTSYKIPPRKNPIRIGDSLIVSFHNSQEITFENYKTERVQTLSDSASYITSNPVYRFINSGQKMIFHDYGLPLGYLFDGVSVEPIKETTNENFKRIRLKFLTDIELNNKLVAVSIGLKDDNTEGGYIYSFDASNGNLNIVYSFTEPFFSNIRLTSKSNKHVLIHLDNKVIITDLVNSFAFNIPFGYYSVEIKHSFSNNTFIVKEGYRDLYVYNSEDKSHRLIVKGESIKEEYAGTDHYYYTDNSGLNFIDQYGKVTNIISEKENPEVIKTSEAEILFFTQSKYGKIDLVTGGTTIYNTTGARLRASSAFKINGLFYVLSRDGVLNRIDFGRGQLLRQGTEKFISAVGITDSTAYFHSQESGFITAWKFNGNKMLELFSLVDLHYGYDLTKPFIQPEGNTKFHLWWPQMDRLIGLNSQILGDIYGAYVVNYSGKVAYFYTQSYNETTFVVKTILYSINTDTKQISFLMDLANGYFKAYMFNGQLYIANSEGIWLSNKEGTVLQLESDLSHSYVENVFLEFRGNLYIWALDNSGVTQLWQLTDNEPKDDEEDILLSSENPSISFSFYPNPTQDYLNVSSTSETENKYKITVFGTDGKVISEQHLELPQKLDLSSLKEGTYLINVRTGKDNKTFRVVKQ